MPSWSLVLIGFVLSLLGVALPFLMVIHLLQSTFFLNFFSVGAMMAGLALGIAGAGQFVRRNRK